MYKLLRLAPEIKIPLGIFVSGLILLIFLKIISRPKQIVVYTMPEEYEYYW